MPVIYGSVEAPPAPPVELWPGMRVTWQGWDGSLWELSDPATGVVLAAAGVEGLGTPPTIKHVGVSPAVHGSWLRGWIAEPRSVFWPVHVFGDSSAEWVDRDSAFWASMHPGKYGVWTVTQTGSGAARSLDCRFVDDGQASYPVDPSSVGWASYGVTLTADDPFWYGPDVVAGPWVGEAGTDFFYGTGSSVSATTQVAGDTVTATAHGLTAGLGLKFTDITGTTGLTVGQVYYVAGTVTADTFQVSTTQYGTPLDLTGVDGTATYTTYGGPPFTVGSGFTLANAAATNSGDVDAYPVWTIKGPVDSVTVGVNGRTIAAPIVLTADDTLTIDADPRVLAAYKNGSDVTTQLGEADFAPIPAGAEVPLTLSMTGTGSVSVRFRPRYFRAW